MQTLNGSVYRNKRGFKVYLTPEEAEMLNKLNQLLGCGGSRLLGLGLACLLDEVLKETEVPVTEKSLADIVRQIKGQPLRPH